LREFLYMLIAARCSHLQFPIQQRLLCCYYASYIRICGSLEPVIHNCVGFVGRYMLLVAVHVCVDVCGGGGGEGAV
jgi:hypothetical protein